VVLEDRVKLLCATRRTHITINTTPRPQCHLHGVDGSEGTQSQAQGGGGEGADTENACGHLEH